MADAGPVSIDVAPKAGQLVQHEGKTYRTVKEGLAYILIPPNAKTSQDPKVNSKNAKESVSEVHQNVFYNPIQQFNRDLSVLAIKAFGEDFCLKQNSRRQQQKQKNDGRNERRKDRKVGRNDLKRKLEEDGTEHKVVKIRRLDNGKIMDETNGNAYDAAKQIDLPHSEVDQDGITTADATPIVENLKAKEAPQPPWKPRFRILDALSATGLRALRYAQEIPFATAIIANDMDQGATKSIELNVKHNGLESMIVPNTGNAIGHMYHVAYPPHDSHGPQHVSAKYDVIDLDPYGTAAPFIDAALQALNDGGLLCVTCTDSGVFASCGYSEKTFALYGGMPAKGAHSHETGLRLILNSIATSAAKIGLAIEPLLSLSIDFYVRVFVRVRKSPAEVKFYPGKTMLTYECDHGCGAWHTQSFGRNSLQQGKNNTSFFKHPIAQGPSVDRLCEHCGSKMHVAGPMWAGPLHNGAFISRILEAVDCADGDVYYTKPRLEGMLDTALEELAVNEVVLPKTQKDNLIPKLAPEVKDNAPFFFIPSVLSKVMRCSAPAEAFIKGALRHAGYKVARSHCKPGSIKTNAPWPAIWHIMREWIRQKAPIKEGALREGMPGYRIMQAAAPPQELTTNEDHSGGEKSSDGTPEVVTELQAAQEPHKEPHKDPSRFKVVFDEALGRDKPGKKKLVRYQENPRENWGPMSRAKGSG
ncbi:TRM-domain-containing protein [Polychaeton citri CBS 116435]|uniref:tRNA (guanine(26)-N(2))-dimethyltransferase n=1 Tax=Polychaeton citri CBS 116435 TaxID=1314669 RepID=A0A9P4UQT6_9PEZI|nr:TRM-domain-containing protein [Polychaeton citri CBS 116435]